MAHTKDHELIRSTLIHQLDPISLRARLVVEGFLTGLHRSPYHGFSVEFAEHRMYQPGDPLRHLDWKVYGRSDRFYIKQYQEETNLRAMVLLDCSKSMDFASAADVSKLTYGKSLAAALIYLLLNQRDGVGLTLFDDSIREILPVRSAQVWRNELWAALERSEPGGETNVGSVLHDIADRMGRRALIILISDLMDDPESLLTGLHHFRHLGHEVLVFQVMDKRELDFSFDKEARFEELESGRQMVADPWQVRDAYREEMQSFLEHLREGCARRSVEHHLLTTDTPLDEALMSFLLRRRQL